MTISVKCSCGKQYKVSDRLAGKTLKCRACGGRMKAPSSPAAASPVQTEPQASDATYRLQPTSPAASEPPADDHSSFAATEGGIDLTVTTEYKPSGRCGRPWMIVPLAPVGVLATYLAGGIGLVIGAVVGFICVGIPGMLMDQFKLTQTITGGNTMRNMGATVGSTFGVYIGEVVGLAIGAWLFNRMAHNRSVRMAIVFASVTLVLAISPYVLFAQEAIQDINEQYPDYAGYYWWAVAGMVLFGIVGVLFAPIAGVNDPYCEECRSYLKKAKERKYAKKAEKIVGLAKQGAIQPLKKLAWKEGEKNYTGVYLDTCKQGCCAYLRIVSYWLAYDEQSKQEVTHEAVKVHGFLDASCTKEWMSILDTRPS